MKLNRRWIPRIAGFAVFTSIVLAPLFYFGLPASTAQAKTDITDNGLWTEDVAAAMETAKKENKDMLLDFTGSDWCVWCHRLDDEVFETDAFRKEAPKHFALVKLDFPNNREIPEKIQKQNREWQSKFGVRGYPTIILTDSQGRGYAQLGYQQGGAEAYLKTLAAKRDIRVQRDELFAKAEKTEGVEKAKLLDEALDLLPENMVMISYTPVMEQIVEADKDNEAGLKKEYNSKLAMARLFEVQTLLNNGKTAEALKLANAIEKDASPTGEAASRLLALRHHLTLKEEGAEAAEKVFTDFEARIDKDDAESHLALLEVRLGIAWQNQDFDKVPGLIDAFLKDHKPKNVVMQQQLTMAKASALLQMRKTKEAIAVAREAIALEPKSPIVEQIEGWIEENEEG